MSEEKQEEITIQVENLEGELFDEYTLSEQLFEKLQQKAEEWEIPFNDLMEVIYEVVVEQSQKIQQDIFDTISEEAEKMFKKDME